MSATAMNPRTRMLLQAPIVPTLLRRMPMETRSTQMLLQAQRQQQQRRRRRRRPLHHR